jgi:hypothetical protein
VDTASPTPDLQAALQGDLSSDEVIRRLSEQLPAKSGSLLTRGNGTIIGNRFTIRRRFNPFWYNTADFEFVGQVQDNATGSILTGRLGPNESQPIFMGCWIAFMGFGELFFCIDALNPKWTTPPFNPLLTLFPLGLGAFGIVVVCVAVGAARARWKSTEAWLMDLVSATP